MGEIWLIADLHLGHQRLVDGWGEAPGSRKGPRGQFRDADDMDAFICERWRATVAPQDKIYLLGDVALKKSSLLLIKELPGHKRLVLGNHDQEKPKLYAELFEKVCGAKTLEPGFVLTHIPVHPSQLSRKSMRVNIHGHLHDEVVQEERLVCGSTATQGQAWTDGQAVEPYILVTPDPRYVCVSCEQVDYRPVNLDVIIERTKDLMA